MILINQSYDIVTPESAEAGDAAEYGMLQEDSPHSFRELIDLLENHPEPSTYPIQANEFTWFSSYSDTDYRTGETKTTSVHFSRNNPARNLKYWEKAIRYVFGNKVKP